MAHGPGGSAARAAATTSLGQKRSFVGLCRRPPRFSLSIQSLPPCLSLSAFHLYLVFPSCLPSCISPWVLRSRSPHSPRTTTALLNACARKLGPRCPVHVSQTMFWRPGTASPGAASPPSCRISCEHKKFSGARGCLRRRSRGLQGRREARAMQGRSRAGVRLQGRRHHAVPALL